MINILSLSQGSVCYVLESTLESEQVTMKPVMIFVLYFVAEVSGRYLCFYNFRWTDPLSQKYWEHLSVFFSSSSLVQKAPPVVESVPN